MTAATEGTDSPTAGGVGEQGDEQATGRPARYDPETRTWRDAETGEPVPTEPAWDLYAPEDES